MLLGNGFGFWNTMPTRRRTSMVSTSGAYMSWPWYVMVPLMRAPGMRSFMRLKHRSTVDLPQPDGPIIAVIMFWPKSMSTSRTAS